MKHVLNLSAVLIIICLSACKDDSNEISASDKKINLLTAQSWGEATVSHDDGDLSDQYLNFVIMFSKSPAEESEGTYMIANGSYAFSETIGTWRLSNDLTRIILDSGKEMEFTVSESGLQLAFTVAPSGKTTGVSGHFVFDLKPYNRTAGTSRYFLISPRWA